jgi:hypothetical protein
MNPRKFSILIAFLALIASILACSLGGELSLTNPRMSFDEPGEQVTTVYSPGDAFYAVGDLDNAPLGTVVSAKWYAVNVEGYESGFIDETTLTIDEDNFGGYVSFQYTYQDASGWPVGEYKAELYLNGALTHTLNFSVQ